MSSGRNHDPPPAYEDVIRSSIYTIPVFPATVAVPHNDGQSHSPPPRPSETRGNRVRDYLMMPPSYSSLFGSARGRRTSPSADSPAPQPASTNTSEQSSTQPAALTPEPTPQAPQQTTSTTPETDEEKAKRKATLVKKFVIMPTIFLAFAACISMLYVASNYACEASKNLAGWMSAFGVVGIVASAYSFFVLWLHLNGRKPESHNKQRNCLITLTPVMLAVTYIGGSSQAYRVWQDKPCHPLEIGSCAGYCDNELMMYSFIFYISITILLSPLWLLILYVIFGTLFKCMRKICKDMKAK